MTAKQKTEPTPAAQLETARAELEQAEREFSALDIHRGRLDEAATRRRELSERIEIARERLQVAQDRFDEYEYGRIEGEIGELQADARQIENELAAAREQAAADLRARLNPDWLDGRGRFSSERPALPGLLGFCTSVSEIEGRRDLIHAQIRSLERRIETRRQERSRQAAAERVDRRRRLIAGASIEVPLSAWRFVAHVGFVPDVADSLERKFVPMAMVDPRGREIHCLLPSDSGPHGWADNTHLESAAPLDPTELCPAMAAVWQRANPPKKSGASRR